jgi:hypothetical protein
MLHHALSDSWTIKARVAGVLPVPSPKWPKPCGKSSNDGRRHVAPSLGEEADATALGIPRFGEAILFADGGVLVWAAAFWLICNVFVLGYEAPVLARKFGKSYDIYRGNVPRWFPRPVPWKSPAD